ncbi:MAG: hypothetical protein JSS28_10825, partial [Proteobacteria bacterium]|nr:hypothetical protein [Pseudomonadota bacterium]
VADNRIVVRWNGTQIGSASADGSAQSGNIVWTRYRFPAQPGAAGSSTLEIQNVDACDGLGAMLDDVAVVQAVPPTPTPALGRAALALLGVGLFLLALVAARRRSVT